MPTTGFCLMKQLIFILFAFCVISNTYASDECLHRPGCEELGYTQTRKKCACFNKDVLPCPFNIKDDNTVFCGDLNCASDQCGAAVSLYNGKENTRIMFFDSGYDIEAKAPYAALLFYVGDKEGEFGQGKWYLPSIGEWIDIYGANLMDITNSVGSSGSVGNNKTLIENALKKLADKNAEADVFVANKYYLSSNLNERFAWVISMSSGYRRTYARYDGGSCMRVALLLKDLDVSGGKPKIGDVVYTDSSFGSVDTYDGTKTPAGIVFAVSENGTMAKIINLKDLTFFKASGETNLFDPENPYNNLSATTALTLNGPQILGIEDIDSAKLVELYSNTCGCDCEFYGKEEASCDLTAETCVLFDKAFNSENCTCATCPTGSIIENGKCVVALCAEKCATSYALFAGQDNTKAAVQQTGNSSLAAYAATQFYVGNKNGDFGQGKWYLPSIGEWMDFYGTDSTQITAGSGTSGSKGQHRNLINRALRTLDMLKGVEATVLGANGNYASSSETGTSGHWVISLSKGNRASSDKIYKRAVRCALLLKNCFDPSSGETAPKIGDVMYLDKTWGEALDYDGSKKAVGIIASVSADKRNVTIINLKDLTFSSTNMAENFDPDNPYGGSNTQTSWIEGRKYENIQGIPDIATDKLLPIVKASGNCPCQFYKP